MLKRKHKNRDPQMTARGKEKKSELNREHISIFQVVSKYYRVRRVLPEGWGAHSRKRVRDSKKLCLDSLWPPKLLGNQAEKNRQN